MRSLGLVGSGATFRMIAPYLQTLGRPPECSTLGHSLL